MVVLAIASVAIISLQGNIFKGRDDNTKIQVGLQLMQECAEQILATRRTSGFSAVDAASCAGMAVTGYAAPTFQITAGNSTTAGMAACPLSSGSNCKLVSITQGSLTPITLLLVNY